MTNDLKNIIREDKKYYYGSGLKKIYRFLTHNPLYQRGRYIIIARKAGYYSVNNTTLKNKLLQAYYTRKKNILGERLGI